MKIAQSEKDVQPQPATGGYTAAELAGIVGLPLEQVGKWVSQGLLQPGAEAGAEARFDFRQITIAQTLQQLSAGGADLAKLRKAIKRLRTWLPEVQQPIVRENGRLCVRLDEGDLAEPDGQLCLEFANTAEGESPLRISKPRSPREWYECGVSHEAAGDLGAAVESYRQALLEGGPDKDISLVLAHALAASGEPAQAAERDRQVIELDPQNADAWNNLGVALAEIQHNEEAARAFSRVLELRSDDARARYNLADTLDEIGEYEEAAEHWRAYLRHDQLSAWAAHARKRLAVS